MSVELLCNRLLSALFNGGYQGLLLTGLMWLGLKLARRTNAATRHAVWFATLLVVAALPAVHFLLPARNSESAGTAERSAMANRPSAVFSGDDLEAGSAGAHAPATEAATLETRDTPQFLHALDLNPVGRAPWHQGDATDIAGESPEWAVAGSTRGFEVLERAALDGGIADASSDPLAVPTGPPVWRFPNFRLPFPRELSQAASHWPLSLPDGTGRALIGLWLVLAAVRLASLVRDFVGLHSFKRGAAPAPEHLRVPFVVLTAEMEVRRPTRLLLCPGRQAPMVVGFRNPAVLLPERLVEGVPSEQLQQVLRHELAHVGRGDDWANLIQQVIKAVLFFHPAVWWLCRRLTLEREVACDDHVLAASRTPRAYALFLTEFAGRMQSHRLAAAPAAWSNQSQLKERIAMILDSQRNASPRLAGVRVGILTLTTALIAVGALLAGPRLALAAAGGGQDPQEPQQVTTEEEFDVSTSVSVQVDAGTVEVTVTDEELPGAATSQTASARIISPGSPGQPAGVASSGPRMKTPPRMTLSHAPTPAPVAVTLPTPVSPPGAPAPVVVIASPPVPEVAVNVHPMPVPPHPVFYAQAPGAGQPAPPPPGRSLKGASDTSVERRLDRLERMMEELLAHQKVSQYDSINELALKFDHQIDGKLSDELSAEFQRIGSEFNKEKFAKLSAELGKIAEKAAKSGLDESEVARIKDQVRKDVERAARDMERAAKDFQRAAQDASSAKSQNRAHAALEGQPLRTHRMSLEARRKALEKQLEAVERQLEQLEEEQEELNERHEDVHENVQPPNTPKPGGAEKPESDENAPKRKPSLP